jgi:hypothetical protein
MSTIQTHDVSRAARQSVALESVAVRPDFQFWQDVFDQAQGSSPQGAPGHGFEEDQWPGPAAQRRLSEHAQTSMLAVGSTPILREQGLAIAKTVAHALAQPLLTSTTLLPGTLAYAQTSAKPPRGGAAGMASDADVAVRDTTKSSAHQAQADDTQALVAMQAHVMLTDAGDWKVALRAGRHVTVAQALAAVAQALAQQQQGLTEGQVEQVVLNGKPIYQRSARQDAAPPATSTFEINC